MSRKYRPGDKRHRPGNLPPRTTVFPLMVESELHEALKGIDRDSVRAALVKLAIEHGRSVPNIIINYYYDK